jgi:hypothetical protein
VGAAIDADSVSVVLHVAVQLPDEMTADTPDGNEDVENDTANGFPETSVAVTPSLTDVPCVTESAGAAEDTEIAVTAGLAVVKV